MLSKPLMGFRHSLSLMGTKFVSNGVDTRISLEFTQQLRVCAEYRVSALAQEESQAQARNLVVLKEKKCLALS